MGTDEITREEFYEQMWKDFISLQHGDAKQLCIAAARYRWLRDKFDDNWSGPYFELHDSYKLKQGSELDAAIDTAMAA